MNKYIIILFLAFTSILSTFGQNENDIIDAPLGVRIIRNGQDYLIYADKNLTPNFNDYRKINYQVYFRKIKFPIKEENGKKYQLITIPGTPEKTDQAVSRIGRIVNKEDYGQNFWIEVEVIEKYTQTEHYKYANDVFSGLLTAPFKYRLNIGSAPESLIDGDFNIAPFFGWKWRLSSIRPFYIAPFGFAGVTTLDYNSANNSKIIDSEKLENGAGLTYGAGISFRFGNVSPGFAVGWDKGFGDLGSGFLYSDKAWISFSINYDFFKPNQISEGSQ